ncbi:hypothetical protein GCM10009613_61450 [Pseudonocardia kongjuensis]|uniref:Transposase zinc-ribbon domain-containing protein n=1 Tax=Pseudonocardia kongjuensis TaxID=102227 RepID=A0ABN1YA12_9PSEU
MPDQPTAQQRLRAATEALRPRCWCGCPEAVHLPPRYHQRRTCPRCGPALCVSYVQHNENGKRVTAGHRAARLLSDLRVDVAVRVLRAWTFTAPTIPIPAQRRPADGRAPNRLRRADM